MASLQWHRVHSLEPQVAAGLRVEQSNPGDAPGKTKGARSQAPFLFPAHLDYAVYRSNSSGFRMVSDDPLIAISWLRRNWFNSRVTVSLDVPAIFAISS